LTLLQRETDIDMSRNLTVHLLITLSSLLLSGTIGAADTVLPPGVQAELQKAAIPSGSVAIWAQAVDGQQPSLSHNADRLMNPASVMKLVTAFAALDILGPARVWTTHLASDGSIEEGVLKGNLYLIGSADPLLNQERLTKMFSQVRALGIETIEGDIVVVDSALRLPPHDPYAFDNRGLRPYNSGAYGALLHFNTLQLLLIPGKGNGSAVTVVPIPRLGDIHIDNHLTTTTGKCGIWYSGLDAKMEKDAAGSRLVLLGSLPASCGPQSWGVAPLSPAQFSQSLVAAQWAELGGGLSGRVRIGAPPAQRTILASNTSPALAEIVREMNKWSSNIIARQLLANLGARRDPAAENMVEAGAAAALESLQEAGVTIDGLHIENGAGLSRNARIRADSLGAMLIAAWRRPFMPEFISALPIAGVDGTARRNLGRNAARGYAHLKTGTINNVRAIAGYLQDRNGRRHAFVMMVNHAKAVDSLNAQNALLEWLWQGEGK